MPDGKKRARPGWSPRSSSNPTKRGGSDDGIASGDGYTAEWEGEEENQIEGNTEHTTVDEHETVTIGVAMGKHPDRSASVCMTMGKQINRSATCVALREAEGAGGLPLLSDDCFGPHKSAHDEMSAHHPLLACQLDWGWGRGGVAGTNATRHQHICNEHELPALAILVVLRSICTAPPPRLPRLPTLAERRPPPDRSPPTPRRKPSPTFFPVIRRLGLASPSREGAMGGGLGVVTSPSLDRRAAASRADAQLLVEDAPLPRFGGMSIGSGGGVGEGGRGNGRAGGDPWGGDVDAVDRPLVGYHDSLRGSPHGSPQNGSPLPTVRDVSLGPRAPERAAR